MKHYHFEELASTNETAQELLKSEDFIAVSAGLQNRGKGRNGKIWRGNKNENVYCSFGIRHRKRIELSTLVSYQMLGTICAMETLVEITGKNIFKIKYPNDLMVIHGERAKKICGVLVENEFQGGNCTSSVIGIGININQEEFEDELNETAVSLKMLGYTTYPVDICRKLIERFELNFEKSEVEIRSRWQRELDIIGKRIQVAGENGSWIVDEILEEGSLKLRNETDGRIRSANNGDTIRYDYF